MSVNIFGSNSSKLPSNNKKYVESKFITLTKHLETGLASKLNKDGDTMKGNLNVNNNKIINIGDPSNNCDAVNKQYLDKRLEEEEDNIIEMLNTKVSKTNDIMNGNLDLDHNRITNLSNPLNDLDAVNKEYVERSISNAVNLKLNKNNLGQEISKLQLYTLSTTGLVPNLFANNDRTGYIVNASGEFADSCYKVFHPTSDWKANAKSTEEFWISIKCIKPVKIYMFTIKPTNNTKLIHWKIQGKNMIINWEDLPFNLSPISDLKSFEINPKLAKEYIEYRILITEAEHDNNTPGLSHWQLFTVDPVYVL